MMTTMAGQAAEKTLTTRMLGGGEMTAEVLIGVETVDGTTRMMMGERRRKEGVG